MVPRREPALTAPRRRALLAFAAVAGWIAWQGGAGGGTPPLPGALAPPLAAGLTVAIALSLVDRVTTPLAGVLAGAMLFALPGFVPLHLGGAPGPMVLLATVVQLAALVHAPRWSLAHGALGAAMAVFVHPAALGLAIAAVWWAALPHGPSAAHRGRRLFLALLPVAVAVAAGQAVGNAWPPDGGLGWHGGLDRGLRAAGTIVGDQLAPGISSPAVRFFAIADLSLLLIALLVMGWWRLARTRPVEAPLRRWYAATAILAASLALGLASRRLLVRGTPDPALEAVMPLVVLGTLATVVSLAAFWPRWPRWAKALALVLLLGWLQAAVRG